MSSKSKLVLVAIGLVGAIWYTDATSQPSQSSVSVKPAVEETIVTPAVKSVSPSIVKPTVGTDESKQEVNRQEVNRNEEQKVKESSEQPVDSDNLSNDNYYINSENEKVHSPAFAPSVPAGATAQCEDGTMVLVITGAVRVHTTAVWLPGYKNL